MTKYLSNRDVEPVRVTTYRHLRKATRRGWPLPEESEPSLRDLVRIQNGRARGGK